MRFTVIGTDAAGIALEFPIEARGVEEAEHLARQRGVNVARVTLATSGNGHPPIDGAPGPSNPTRSGPLPPPSAGAHPPPPTSSRAQRRAPDLGIASLALGGAALLFCWIPTVGVISYPLGALGVCAGVMACFGAMRDLGAGGGGSVRARLMAPALGVALSSFTLLAAGAIARAAAPLARADDRSPSGTPESNAAPPPARNLTIVTAASAPDRPAEPAPIPSTAAASEPSLRLGAAEFRVLSSDLMHVPLIDDRGRSQGISKRRLILLRVEVRNTGDSAIEYRTISGEDATGLREGAALADGRGRTLRRTRFPLSVVPVGRVASETLLPGRSLTDVVTFDPPAGPPAAGRWTLRIPGESVGVEGDGVLSVPDPIER